LRKLSRALDRREVAMKIFLQILGAVLIVRYFYPTADFLSLQPIHPNWACLAALAVWLKIGKGAATIAPR
jgi:hypothetical protein